MRERLYLCIDLKSFYASVECVERGLDPLTALLAVADPERSDRTICLAVSPAMKKLGVANRCRVFQIPPGVNYIMAPPRMKLYIEYSAKIYGIYLKYAAKEDIHVYSVDEVFLDITDYLALYRMDAEALARKLMDDIRESTGITAAAGIGSNLYLAKIALDITAKHSPDHMGVLDEEGYRRTLWQHRPLSDFWRIGSRTEKKLNSMGIFTMEDLTRANEDMLYSVFGIDAELLIDHAWGRESVTMADIKNYMPKSTSVSSGQVLPRNYSYREAELILKEMTDSLCLELLDRGLSTDSLTLVIGYAAEYEKPPSCGTAALPTQTNSYRQMISHVLCCYQKITDHGVPIRRINISCNRAVNQLYQQYDLFHSPQELERERRLQQAVLTVKKRFGGNALLRGMDLLKAGTAIERNRQIGGHKSGE